MPSLKFDSIYELTGPKSVELAQRLGIIRTSDNGPKCGKLYCSQPPMSLANDDSKFDKKRWRCNGILRPPHKKKLPCTYSQSIRKNTIFARSKLPIWKILLFLILWTKRYAMNQIAFIMGSSVACIADWGFFCREALFEAVVLNGAMLGGAGRTVEIDEFKFGKRKYDCSNNKVDGTWVFGGFERETGRIFMVPVACRSSAFLLVIIRHYITKGTTIISDCWREYDCLKDEGFQNLRVHNNINFRDPETGTRFGAIESSWLHSKESINSHGRRADQLGGNLVRYMYSMSCRRQGKDELSEFVRLVFPMYDGSNRPENQQTPQMDEYDRLLDELKKVVAVNQPIKIEARDSDSSDSEYDRRDLDIKNIVKVEYDNPVLSE